MAPSNTLNKADIVWDEPVSAAPPKDAIIWDEPAPPDTGLGKVALNAVPKGVANLAHMPVGLGNLLLSGLSNLPFAGHFETLKNLQNEQMPNVPMEMAERAGVVNPAWNPQTPVQRVADTMIQTGIGAAAGPGGAVRSAATGAAAGGAGQVAKEATGSDMAKFLVSTATPLVLRSTARPEAAQQNAVRDQTLRDAQDLGYKVPPSSVNPSFLNNRLESIAGKAAVKQELSQKNQQITNALVAKELGLPPNTPITEGVLKNVRDTASAPYKEVASLSPIAANALDKLKQTRFEANDQWKYYARTGNPEVRKVAEALSKKADMYEAAIDKVAKSQGRDTLVNELAEARRTIAKTYDIDRALNVGDANISAPHLGRMLDQGKPLSGNLKTIGAFAEGPGRQVVRETAAVPSPGVSGTDAAASAILGTAGYGAAGGPAGLIAAGLPLARGPARSMVTSNWYQNRMAQPDYSGLSVRDKGLNSALIAALLASQQQGGGN